jgi:tetratricopeptide (TPR) repeat protein
MKYWIFVITLLCTALVQAKMYQWVDDKGRTHFSDKPPASILEKPSATKTTAHVPTKSKSNNSGKGSGRSSSSPLNNSGNQPLLILEMRNLLEQKKYQELNSLLELARISALEDVGTEEHLINLYQSFGLTTEAFGLLLNAWVNAYPASYQPFLARAHYFQTMGWYARGAKWGSETSDEQKSAMKSYFSKAEADVNKALNRNPSSLMAYLLLMQGTYVKSGFNELDSAFEKGLKLSPASYKLRQRYIRCQRPRWGGSLEKMIEVVVESEALIDKNPELINLSSWILEDIFSNQYRNGNYTLAKKTLGEGLSKINNAAIQNGYSDVKTDHFILYKQGRVERQLDNYEAALDFFNLAIEGNENGADYYYERSKVQLSLDNYAASTSDLLIALTIDPTDKSYLTFRKRLINNLNYASYEAKSNVKLTKALQLVNFSLQLNPYDIKSLRRRSYVYIAKRQIRQAKQDMDKAMELDRSDYDSYKGMDDVLLMERRFEEIAAYWGKYIALKPNDSRAFFERAGTYYHMKRIDLAVKDAKHAVKLGHPNAEESLRHYKAVLIGKAT